MTGLRVAFLGPHGTFCEQALRTLTPADLDAALGDAEPSEHPLSSTTAALDAVRRGDADAACVPVENSVEGGVPADDGRAGRAAAAGDRAGDPAAGAFAVLVRPGTTAADVTSVASHPHGEAQTRRWIAEHLPGAEVRLTGSTAAAAAQVAAGEVDAAVCAPVAAAHHGLEALATGVHDSGDAVTRFVLVRPPGPPGLPTPTGDDRTSIAATTANRPGALLAVLTEIAMRGVDLNRIESRPLKDRRGEYWFFLDGSGHVADPAMGEALAALRRRCTDVRFLGSYPRAPGSTGPAGTRRPGPASRSPGRPVKDHTEAASWVAALRDGTGA